MTGASDRRGTSLRLRLTLLYTGLMAGALAALAVLVYGTLSRSMIGLVDAALETAVAQAMDEVDFDAGTATFGVDPDDADEAGDLWRSGAAARIIAADGTIRTGLGDYEDLPAGPVGAEGFATRRSPEGAWRVLSRRLSGAGGELDSWLEVLQPLDAMRRILDDMLRLLLLGFPALLALSGAAAAWIAGRALAPLTRIARTAASIGREDLSRRLAYAGAVTEIRELAASFDSMLERLESAFAHERRFTADAAHELRTPLTAIKGQVEVALRRTRTVAAYKRTLTGLLQHVDRLARLANDLLFMARLDRPGAVERPSRVALGELLDLVLEQLAPRMREKRIAFSASGADGAAVRGDLDHLIRLFLNLVDNAVTYTPRDGSVAVDVDCRRGEVRVRISNTGDGIPARDLRRVFERFYRVQRDRSRQSGGAGLGLAIARDIARRCGGDITAESTPGDVTTFTVLLPAAAVPDGG